MKVLIDTNVLLSYLLRPWGNSAPIRVVVRSMSGIDDPLVPEYVLGELRRQTRNNRYFTSRVSEDAVELFIHLMERISIPIPITEAPILYRTRDPNDDVLVAIALAAGVDYLISGDKDLLELGDTLAPLKIRSPQAFLDEIERESDPGEK